MSVHDSFVHYREGALRFHWKNDVIQGGNPGHKAGAMAGTSPGKIFKAFLGDLVKIAASGRKKSGRGGEGV